MLDLAEVDALLKAATPGEWLVGVDRIWSRESEESVCEFPKFRPATREFSQAMYDAEFIAAAPRLLAELRDEVVRLRAEVEARPAISVAMAAEWLTDDPNPFQEWVSVDSEVRRALRAHARKVAR